MSSNIVSYRAGNQYVYKYATIKDGYNVAVTFSIGGSRNTTFDWAENESPVQLSNFEAHASAITDITETEVTFINPWNSAQQYTLTWSEFANIGIKRMSWAIW